MTAHARIEQRIEVLAPPDLVWSVMTDVERWPEWTASVRHVELLDGGPLEIGRRARIRQPRLPVAIYAVTEWEGGRSFEWQSTALGMRTIAGHLVVPVGASRSRVTLTVDWTGPLAPIVRLLYGRLTRRYVETEARGLKLRCEGARPQSRS